MVTFIDTHQRYTVDKNHLESSGLRFNTFYS